MKVKLRLKLLRAVLVDEECTYEFEAETKEEAKQMALEIAKDPDEYGELFIESKLEYESTPDADSNWIVSLHTLNPDELTDELLIDNLEVETLKR